MAAARPVLRAGETEPLTVTSNGAPVSGVAWVSSDTSVLSVNAAGLASAGRAGRVTVTATAGSSSGSLAMRVVPDYQGTWTGGIARLQLTCAVSSTAPICAPGAVTSGTVELRIQQSGGQLTATLLDSAEPAVPVPLTGQVEADDQMALAGRASPASQVLRVDVLTLRGTLDVALGAVTGSYQWIVDRAPAAGAAFQEDYRAQVQFRDLRR